jgi:hypothetical protein
MNLEQMLNNAKKIALTDEENMMFSTNYRRAIEKVSERTGINLASGRVAHAPAMKLLMVVD